MRTDTHSPVVLVAVCAGQMQKPAWQREPPLQILDGGQGDPGKATSTGGLFLQLFSLTSSSSRQEQMPVGAQKELPWQSLSFTHLPPG